ncbi:MAG: tRNA (pseudouridine(54)-N(1))-methyltransferase TrmY [Haloarculaceae archaeon]
MRRFVVLGHEAAPDPGFSLDDLPGAGRLDVLCRCMTDALLTSHGVRGDTTVSLVFGDEYTVRFEGSEVRRLNPDERSTGARLRDALAARDGAIGAMEAEPSPGVYVGRRGFEATLDRLDGTVVELHEDGTPVVEVDPPEDVVFVLSDHRDFTAAEAELLAERADARVTLGPERLHADQAVTVAHNWLDTDGFARY